MVLSQYAKQRILVYYFDGTKSSTRLKKLLEGEGIHISRVSVWKFIRHFRETNCLARKEGSGHPTKITAEVKRFVEAQMQHDDETTAYQLHKILTENGFYLLQPFWDVDSNCMGWTFRGIWCV